MGAINKLSPFVANLIAAGEVVERPASVVKELCENSLDAHADHITVEIRNGGTDMIKINDNGIGMTREDACACFMRHATSKISTEDDLDKIITLGFRGEALAAISSVSHVELITRYHEDEVGTRVTVEAGEVTSCEECGAPIGTTMTISNIFYNTPARMKFLKKNSSEGTYVAGVIDRIAMSHPELSIRFIKDGREALHTSGDNSLISSIHTVLGREFAESLADIGESHSPLGFTVWGYVTKPEKARSNRNMQYFFLNGRSIKNRSLGAALEEAYRDSIMVGKFPGCVLHMCVNPERVDCNVHPAKIEVKFADERGAFEALYFAVKNAISNGARPQAVIHESIIEKIEIPSNPKQYPISTDTNHLEPIHASAHIASPSIYEKSEPVPFVYSKKNEPASVKCDMPEIVFPSIFPDVPKKADEPKPYRILGELFDSYIVVEVENEALFIDKHAAHERIIYNKLISSENNSAAQLLMTPAVVPVSKEELALIEENHDFLSEIGFEMDEFGGNTLLVRELPAHIDEDGIPELISEIASHLSHAVSDRNRARDYILHSMACKAAVKAGRKSGREEIDVLVRDVLTLSDIRYCPHGRPVAIVMTRSDFEKNFKRI